MDTLNEWVGALSFLNPNYEIDVQYEGNNYRSLRNAFEATKFQTPETKAELMHKHPWQAMQLGLSLPTSKHFSEWRDKIEDLLLEFLVQKFGLVKFNTEYKQHLKLAYWLACTYQSRLVYANLNCDTLLGRCYCVDCSNTQVPGFGTGLNILGRLTEAVRERITPPTDENDLLNTDCDFCFYKRQFQIITGNTFVIYMQNGRIRRKVTCAKHRGVFNKEISREADNGLYYEYPITTTPDLDEEFMLPAVVEKTKTVVLSSTTSWIKPASDPAKATWGFSMSIGEELDHYVLGAV